MKNLRVIFKRKDGGVSITRPTIGLNGVPSGFEVLTGKGGYPLELAEKDIERLVTIDGKKEENIRPYYEGLIIGGFTEEEALHLIAKHAWIDDYISYRITSADNIPTERKFREAWNDESPAETVDICINKSKDIKKEEFRSLRKPKLEALDLEMMRRIGRNEPYDDIELKKQTLRDITNVDMPDNIGELSEFMPQELK